MTKLERAIQIIDHAIDNHLQHHLYRHELWDKLYRVDNIDYNVAATAEKIMEDRGDLEVYIGVDGDFLFEAYRRPNVLIRLANIESDQEDKTES